MLENIVRHIEGGMRPFEAALKGSREIGFTIVSITFSLIAVFIPVLLMGGMVGRVFREFAVTISIAIIISGFVSLTLTPMLCARVLRAHDPHKKENIVLRAFERMLRRDALGLRADARSGAAPQADHAGGHDGHLRSARSGSMLSRRKASSRWKIPATCSASPKARPTSRSRRWPSGSARSPILCGAIPRSLTSTRRSAPAAPIRSAIPAAC